MNNRRREYTNYLNEHINAFNHCYPLAVDTLIKIDPSAESKLRNFRYPPDHDLDKFRSDMLDSYLNYLYPTKEVKDGDWNSYLSNVRDAYYKSWNEHQKSNPHHWQYWVCITDDGYKALEVPINYVAEMLADWATFMYIGKSSSIVDWYLSHRSKMILHPNTRLIMDKGIPLMENRVRKLLESRKDR